jgi:Phage integrase SAM-like domain
MDYLNDVKDQKPANDAHFSKNRSRTVPLIDTLTSIPNYPSKLKIFKTRASRFWQVRCYVGEKYVVRSLRTIQKQEAIGLAKLFYESEVLNIYNEYSSSEFNRGHKIEVVAKNLREIENLKMKRGEISKTTEEIGKLLLNKYTLHFFQNKPIEIINSEAIENFYQYLKNKGLKPVSIAQNLSILRKLFTIAIGKKWVKEYPIFPKIKKTTNSRGGFKLKEYQKIVRSCKYLEKLNEDEKYGHRYTRNGIYAQNEPLPYEFKWLIRFMVNSFLRPVDIKIIQHQHIQIVKGRYCYLRITLPETKLHNGQIISLPAAVHVYEKIKLYFDNLNLSRPTDYLFFPKIKDRQIAMSVIDRHFKKLLEYCDLRYGVRGQTRTLYSLRHTAITFRLLYGKGIDLLTLAKNARTSVEMIEKHYASELTAEMNVGMLHSRR